MNNFLSTTFFTIMLTSSALSQTVKDNLDKLYADPKTAENAAKADVRLHNKKVIADTTTTKAGEGIAPKKKKKNCKRSAR